MKPVTALAKPRPRREKFPGLIEKETRLSIGGLLIGRKSRFRGIVKKGAKIGWIGAGAGFAARLVFTQNPSALTVRDIALGYSAGVLAGILLGVKVRSSQIRNVTERVGERLFTESQKNSDMKAFLKRHKFVIIGKKGEIVGTNLPRSKTLWFGRYRLETAKILSDYYAKSRTAREERGLYVKE